MTAWQYLLKKGTGATAFAILLSSITASDTWDALVQKSTAPDGSTAWVHLISALDTVPVVSPGGGGGRVPRLLLEQAQDEDKLLLEIIDRIVRNA